MSTADVTVLTAVTDPRWEADIVATLSRAGSGVQVVRRCVDLADLLAASAAGLARVAVVSADLRRLDRESLTRLAASGVAVVAVVAAGDDDADRRVRQLGVAHVVGGDATTADVAEAVDLAATSTPLGGAAGWGDPWPPSVPGGAAESDPSGGDGVGDGRIVAVWGPAGGPGRTTVAVNLAAELADLGVRTLLVDADVYGGTVAQVLGVLDESPGLAAACRLANNGSLDVLGLAELALEVRPGLRVLSGITRSSRWPELRSSALDVVLALARTLATVTVVDCGFCLERDEELSFDTAAPRRNGATLTALESADQVLGVCAGDPVGLHRYIRAVSDLAEAMPAVDLRTVVNRVRPAVVGGGNARREIGAALQRFAGLTDLTFLPLDMAGCDAALAAGRTLLEAAPTSPVRSQLRALAAGLADTPLPSRRRRLFSRR